MKRALVFALSFALLAATSAHAKKRSATDTNKQAALAFYEEVYRKGNYSYVDQFFSPTYTKHDPGKPGAPFTEAVEKQALIAESVRKAFPDLAFTIDFVMAEKDLVAIRWTITGTHDSDFAFAKASHKKVVFSGINIFRMKAGKVIEIWNHRDDLAMFIQMGALSPPSPNKAASPPPPPTK